MKIFIPHTNWIGNWGKYFYNAFEGEAIEVLGNKHKFHNNSIINTLKLDQISKIKNWSLHNALRTFNEQLIQDCIQEKPDIFMVMNESKLYPTTIKTIRERCKCTMVLILADDPYDSIRYVADFPHSLKYFDFIFNGEPAYNINVRKAAPNAKIFWHVGGFDSEYYHLVDDKALSMEDVKKYTCELSFTGSSYGPKAEGAYRADILSYLTDYDMKIWGDDNWPYRFKYLPQLQDCYIGTRLPYEDLRKLYHLSKINLNLPAPQVITSFQPRVFEIAACKGFQIVDYRPLIDKVFNENELVIFKTIGELREKVQYFLHHEAERNAIAERLYKKVIENFTWKKWAEKILDTIRYPKKYEELT